MEALPIFLERLVIEWLAIIISVTLVLFFGEYGSYVVSCIVIRSSREIDLCCWEYPELFPKQSVLDMDFLLEPTCFGWCGS
jgi:hypothetical protein